MIEGKLISLYSLTTRKHVHVRQWFGIHFKAEVAGSSGAQSPERELIKKFLFNAFVSFKPMQRYENRGGMISMFFSMPILYFCVLLMYVMHVRLFIYLL